MSLTAKLILGFAFAVVLQIVQIVLGGHFTDRLREASGQVATSLTASLSLQAGLEAVAELRQVAEQHRKRGAAPEQRVLAVYVDELKAQLHAMADCLPPEEPTEPGAPAGIASMLAGLERQLTATDRAAQRQSIEDVVDELAFLDDVAQEIEQELRKVQIDVREHARRGVAEVREVQDVPMRAAIAIALAGVLVMALFVAWFARQLVIPIEQAWSRLDDLVRERTADLAAAKDDLLALNADLSAAKEAADTANAAKTMFLANVSHELRTPLTAILGYAEEVSMRIEERGGDGFELDALQTIQRNTRDLVQIIGDILDTSKLESGRLAVEKIACMPRHVLRDVELMLRPKAEGKGLTLDFDVDEAVPETIVSDPLRLRQIVTNLVHNAIKFTERGRVHVAAAMSGEGQLVIEVADQGAGMSEEALQRVFRPFEQADSTITRRFGGTGLGLVISRHLAELLGGGIEVVSELGKGSMFTVRVAAPRARATDPGSGAEQATRAEVPAGEVLRAARVLVVEDGRDNQLLVKLILQRAGAVVDLVNHGGECMERVGPPTDPGYDLILMDMQMPVMDGLTATKRLRADGHTLPIVALTANAMAADEQACRLAGCDAFLSKPIDRRAMVEALEEQLRMSRDARADRSASRPTSLPSS